MPNSKKPKTIVVTFRKTEDELYDNIIKECSIIKQADWMKIAAKEKLERDHSKIQMMNSTPSAFVGTNSSKPITTADELFK